MDMLKQLDTKEDFEAFFQDFEKKSIVQKAQLYGMAFREQKETLKKDGFRKHIKEDKSCRIVETIVINDFAIIETVERWNGEEKIVYYAVVNDRRLSVVSDSFDMALIYALSYKYGYGTTAPEMIHNMLRMDKSEIRQMGE